MTKSLEQIQKENRKFILSALETVEDTLSKDLFYSKPLTLSRVLLAINRHGYYDDIYFDDDLGTLELDLKGVSFDLRKETLEEQTEETQREINKFFND